MKKVLSTLMFCVMSVFLQAQITFSLDVVAEGNFGSTTGDVFRRNTTVNPATTSDGLYQLANSSTGFDVLQDFEVAGSKALLISKPGNPAGYKVVIADYPSLLHVATFSLTGAPQTIEVASNSKAYVSCSGSPNLVFVDLNAQTVSSVNDPNNLITSYSNHMVYTNGYIYIPMGGNLVKVDTATQTAVSSIALGIGSINNLTADTANNMIYAFSGSTMVSVNSGSNDALGSSVSFSGISSIKHVRYYNNNLYFWSGKDLYMYDVVSQVVPTTAVYTSTLSGGSYSFGYGRSFDIDENTGDFAICSAGSFVAPGLYEVVDGSSFTVIESGSIANCAIPNKCELTTYHASAPVPDITELDTIYGECDVTLVAPTADNGTVTGTTTDPTSYQNQGTFQVTWNYMNSTGSSQQVQIVIVNDTTAPVPNLASLPEITVTCNAQITDIPTATDNCIGNVNATTNDPLMYATAGTYQIEWVYSDTSGNSQVQMQTIQVNCDPNGVNELDENLLTVYPNPANDQLTLRFENSATYLIQLVGMDGKMVKSISLENATNVTIPVNDLPRGMYILNVSGNGANKKHRVVLN